MSWVEAKHPRRPSMGGQARKVALETVKRRRGRMQKKIHCDKCNRWALAKVDGTPLCTACLISTVQNPSGRWRFERIRPLDNVRHNLMKNSDRKL